ncbi:MAG: DUF58 domain-containing protein [Candidatus Omnitrophica bacterium]|nr:DUF58 domain-containing protein [Candidatus Omnitrophota bacterium]
MLEKELLKKVRRIQITSSHMVNDILAGEYHSVFKGRGMEFDEVREYQPGDDIRSIDWNVTARTGIPHIKKYVEERELTVMLIVDASASGHFGTRKQFKNELAAEVGALLAFSAIKNNDKVGLIIFTDEIEKFIPPKKGVRHVVRVIREILYFQPKKQTTNVQAALEYLSSVTKRRTVTFLISDFIDADYERALRIANKRHDVVAVSLNDEREGEMPNIGIVELMDAETGECMLVDTGDAELRKKYTILSKKNSKERETVFKACDVDHVPIMTGQSYIEAIIRFFKMREKRK